MLEVLTFVFLLALYYFVGFQRRSREFPPGPFRWPIAGNFIQVGLEPYKTVLKMKKTYGGIIGLYLGPKRAVFINTHELIKEAFNLPALCGRPEIPFYAIQESGIFRGILSTSGKQWVEQRRFAFSYIRSGLRNAVTMESLILHEANELINDLNEKCSLAMCTRHVFNTRTINSLWSIITGEKYEMSDSKFLKVIEHTEKFASSTTAAGIFIYFPRWSKMFPRISGYQNLMAHINPAMTFCQEIIDRHKNTYQEGIQRDFVDCYLQKIGSTTEKNSSFFGKIGEESLQHSLYHIYLGGMETVSTTLRWLVFLMAHHPETQEKMCNTISKQMQPGQMPSLHDRQQLPFVEAVITEVLRYSSIIPIGVPHEATEDVQFHEYVIPKGTLVFANQYGIAHDPDVWGDPDVFRPERFLNDDETELLEHPAIIPFSIGRRVCPGESLARDELFLFTVRLFQSFKVEFDRNKPTPLLRYINGAALFPETHKVIFSTRD